MRGYDFKLTSLLYLQLVAATFALGETPTAILYLDDKTTLKTLFDAGLRPTKVYSAQETEVEVRNHNIIFRVRGNVEFALTVEQVRFSIANNDVVMQLQAKSCNLTLDAAYSQAVSLFRAAKQVPDNLNEAFQRARSNRRFAPLAEIGITHRSGDGPEVRIGFLPGDINPSAPENLHIRVGLTVYWKDRNHNLQNLRKAPIGPPSGYEDHSMEPILSDNERRLVQSRMNKSTPSTSGTTLYAGSLPGETPQRPETPNSQDKDSSLKEWNLIFWLAMVAAAVTVFAVVRCLQRG